MKSATTKRLLVLYSSHSPVCGIGTWLEALTEHLAPQGWDVVSGLSWGRQFHDPAAVETARPKLQVVRMDARTGTQAARWQAVERTVRHVRPAVALVTLLDDGLRAIGAMSNDVRLGVVKHGNAADQLATILEVRDQLDLAVTVNRASHALLAHWPDANWRDGVLNYIPNAVPIPRGSAASPRTDGVIRIGFVGRLAKDKGAEQLPAFFDAMRQEGQPFELWIAGDGVERGLVEELVDRNREVVRYFGPLTASALQRDVYPHLDVVLCLSPSEGWPMAIGEGMAHGAIPVSSEFIGIHAEQVIRHEETGLIFPVGDVRAAAAAVARLARNNDWKQTLSRSAAREMREHFSSERFGREWAQCLDRCVAAPPRRTRGGAPPPEFHLTARVKECVRRWIGSSVPHASVRSEWPSFKPLDRELVTRVRNALERDQHLSLNGGEAGLPHSAAVVQEAESH